MTEQATWSDEARAQRLALFIHSLDSSAKVMSLGQFDVKVQYRKPVNNVLHVLLTMLTCGLWLVVWAMIGATNTTTYRHFWVDGYGQMQIRLPDDTWVPTQS